MKRIVIVFTLLSGLLFGKGMIISNVEVGKAEILPDEVAKIYLGQMSVWENGSRISVGYVHRKSDTRKEFFRAIVGKSYKQFKKHWVKKVFSGEGVAPMGFKTQSQAVSFVQNNSGAIAFIDTDEVPEGVKVLLRF